MVLLESIAEGDCQQPYPSHLQESSCQPGASQVLGSVKGSELAGRAYRPLFPYFAALEGPGGAFRVVADGYVTADSGTGVVHCAPAFGEDDMRVCIANGAPTCLPAPTLKMFV